MSIKFDGLDDLQNQLEAIKNGVDDLSNTTHLSFAELFPTSFMQRYTPFSSIDDLFETGGFNVESQNDFESIPEADLDKHISATTNFKSWDDMLETATNQYIEQKLGF